MIIAMLGHIIPKYFESIVDPNSLSECDVVSATRWGHGWIVSEAPIWPLTKGQRANKKVIR